MHKVYKKASQTLHIRRPPFPSPDKIVVVLPLDAPPGEVPECVDPRFGAEFHRAEQVLQSDDVAVKVGHVGVVDGKRYVVLSEFRYISQTM